MNPIRFSLYLISATIFLGVFWAHVTVGPTLAAGVWCIASGVFAIAGSLSR